MSEHAAAAASARVRSRDGPRSRVERFSPLALALVAIAATSLAVVLSLTSNHAPQPATHAFLSVVVCFTFVGVGLLALRLRPYERFGWLLAAVGLSSLLGSLHDANNAVLYTIGVFSANLVFAVLAHAILAFPERQAALAHDRALALAAYVDVLLGCRRRRRCSTRSRAGTARIRETSR